MSLSSPARRATAASDIALTAEELEVFALPERKRRTRIARRLGISLQHQVSRRITAGEARRCSRTEAVAQTVRERCASTLLLAGRMMHFSPSCQRCPLLRVRTRANHCQCPFWALGANSPDYCGASAFLAASCSPLETLMAATGEKRPRGSDHGTAARASLRSSAHETPRTAIGRAASPVRRRAQTS